MNHKPIRKTTGNRLTAMMQVRNEAQGYLESVLHDLSEFVDEIVIIDDASSDGTFELGVSGKTEILWTGSNRSSG